MKHLTRFELRVKPNKDYYESVERYIGDITNKVVCSPIEEMIKQDKLVTLLFDLDGKEEPILILGISIEDALTHFKATYPEAHAELPEINIAKFKFISDECKASSTLRFESLITEGELCAFEHTDIDEDDLVGINADPVKFREQVIAMKGYYEIQCYPNSPVGFWNYYGLDFKSLLDHVVED